MNTTIVYGPKGCGKTTMAKALAAHFDCAHIADCHIVRSENGQPAWAAIGGSLSGFTSGDVLLLTSEPDVIELQKMLPQDFQNSSAISFDDAMEAVRSAHSHAALAKIAQITGIGVDYLTDIFVGIDTLQTAIHEFNVKMGWWDSNREDGTTYALIHSEISEAMEGNRKNRLDDHLPTWLNEPVELADALIRILDMGGRKNFCLSAALVEKWAYNAERADHKKENRDKADGKKY